jgi:hypothetical protein
MTIQSFVRQHYSPAAGESPVGHAVAVLSGLALVAMGAALVASIVFLPAGVAIGLLGLLIAGGGVFLHIQSPLKLSELLDALVGLAGAAIAMTFMIAVATFVIGFGVTVAVSLFRWLAN